MLLGPMGVGRPRILPVRPATTPPRMLLSSSGVNQPAKWAQVPSVSLKNPARLGGLPERGQNLVTPQHSLSWGVSDKLEYDFFTQVNAHCSVRGTGQSQCRQFTFYSSVIEFSF